MRRIALFAVAFLTLAGCANTPGFTSTTIGTALADGQLACAAGSAVVAMQAVNGSQISPVLAKGASSAAVKATCALISGVAVAPPANGVAGSVTVTLPPSVSIPLKA